MAAARDLWCEYFSREAIPAFPCPSCGAGRLAIKDQTFAWTRLRTSDQFHSKFGYSPEEEFGRFTCLLVCSATGCREVVTVGGDAFMIPGEDYEGRIEWTEVIEPRFMYPGPPLMDVPEATPGPAAKAMKQAFTAFWGDRGSAANRLRISVERIMDSEGIPSSNGKSALKLFDRIQEFGNIHPDYRDTLDALRHVGNLGSHDGDVSREALLDAFEVYQEWLRNFYGKYPDRISDLVKKLNQTKGRYV